MLNIGVCDDDVKFAGKLEMTLSSIATQEYIEADIDVYFDGEELLIGIEKDKKQYDMIFLDIEMKKLNGLETAKRIRKMDQIVLLIYVTSYKNYAIEAYEVQPFRFIVKPVDINILRKYFLQAYEKIVAGDFYYHYKYKKDYYKVLVNDIVYFESKRRIINIHLVDGTVLQYYDKLNNIENRMKKEKVVFWRIHQSNLVNTRYIISKSYDKILLVNGKTLFISEDRRKAISAQYCEIIKGDMLE